MSSVTPITKTTRVMRRLSLAQSIHLTDVLRRLAGELAPMRSYREVQAHIQPLVTFEVPVSSVETTMQALDMKLSKAPSNETQEQRDIRFLAFELNHLFVSLGYLPTDTSRIRKLAGAE